MSSRMNQHRVLLLDLENVPNELSRLAGEIANFQKVIACYGVAEPKLPLELAKQLASSIHDQRLEFVGMARGGKNAADFGIAFLAGKLMVESPADTEFVILSMDTGLDHVVDMLQRFGCRAKRVAGGRQRSRRKLKSEARRPAEEFCEVFLRTQAAPPRRKVSLRNAIRNYFQRRPSVDAEGVLNELIKSGVVTLSKTGKLGYHLPSPGHDDRELALESGLDEPNDESDVDTVPFEVHTIDAQKTFKWHGR